MTELESSQPVYCMRPHDNCGDCEERFGTENLGALEYVFRVLVDIERKHSAMVDQAMQGCTLRMFHVSETAPPVSATLMSCRVPLSLTWLTL